VRLTRADAKRLGIDLEDRPPEGIITPRPNGMKQGERAYSEHLEARRKAGDILRWDREPEGLRLAERCVYWPDFRVVLPDHRVEFHEVKGRKGAGFHTREDAWIKVKVAAYEHPYRFVLVWPRKGGGWDSRVI
jgi:hypothetical protein